jgi:hypothetical protein
LRIFAKLEPKGNAAEKSAAFSHFCAVAPLSIVQGELDPVSGNDKRLR